ncbi:MAG: hypothetical protein GHCLOJNM_00887 [bacterium]|nr:hypothetical protein [bacterium]
MMGAENLTMDGGKDSFNIIDLALASANQELEIGGASVRTLPIT